MAEKPPTIIYQTVQGSKKDHPVMSYARYVVIGMAILALLRFLAWLSY